MRTLSKQTQYSLRALYALTRAYGSRRLLIEDISRQEGIPKKFLENILLKLKGYGLVGSKTGKGGGYLLSRDPASVTVGEVIRLVEGPLAPLPCASVTAYRKCEECVDARFCETRLVMREVRDAVAQILDSTTLSDVCRRADTARNDVEQPDEALMYYI